MTWEPISYRSKLGRFWPRVSADIAELAENQRQNLLEREDVKKLAQVPWAHRVNDMNQIEPEGDYYHKFVDFIQQLPDEGFKLFPWVLREFKKGAQSQGQRDYTQPVPPTGITRMNVRHANDILHQAIGWMVWSNEHHKPLPDMMSKSFDFKAMEEWVYEMNAANVDHDSAEMWPDSKPVYTWPDGWHVDEVGPSDCFKEGELMGHCVGGYSHAVSSGESRIFSLRDPKGQPHVTTEITDDHGLDLTREFSGQLQNPSSYRDNELIIVQEQGKQNRTPIDEYKNRMQEWYDHLKDEGYEVIWSDDQEPEERYTMAYSTVHPATHEGIAEFYENLQKDPWEFARDEEPEVDYDRGRHIYNYREPNYIGDPNRTYRHEDDDADYPSWAGYEHIEAAMMETIKALWSGQETFYEAQQMAEAYFTAILHQNGGASGREQLAELDNLVAAASNYVATMRTGLPIGPRPHPTLFEPNDYFQRQTVPEPVEDFLWWLASYVEAAKHEGQERSYGSGNSYMEYPHLPDMPGDDNGGWSSKYRGVEFPDYFAKLQENVPHVFAKPMGLPGALSKLRQKMLITALVRMAGYAEDSWSEPLDSWAEPTK